jgi:hypothetical protein
MKNNFFLSFFSNLTVDILLIILIKVARKRAGARGAKPQAMPVPSARLRVEAWLTFVNCLRVGVLMWYARELILTLKKHRV